MAGFTPEAIPPLAELAVIPVSVDADLRELPTADDFPVHPTPRMTPPLSSVIAGRRAGNPCRRSDGRDDGWPGLTPGHDFFLEVNHFSEVIHLSRPML
jgi:hypothetical protein